MWIDTLEKGKISKTFYKRPRSQSTKAAMSPYQPAIVRIEIPVIVTQRTLAQAAVLMLE